MNSQQLRKLGVSEYCIKTAVATIARAINDLSMSGADVTKTIESLVANPEQHVADETFGRLARELISDRDFVRPDPIRYRTWGNEIDTGAHDQMKQACRVPMACGAALMPDAHLGYGLPIGGVLALENAVIPYAVGVDIACRMKMSVLDMPLDTLDNKFDQYKKSLDRGTRFGVGAAYKTPQEHDVMDQDWSITAVTRNKKDKAWLQLGSSGSGNHFVEFGLLTLNERDDELNLDAGQYVALLSHSGSRGVGAAVCSTYSSIARKQLPKKYDDMSKLAWLSLDGAAGQEYWAAMNLMGDYAAANHDVIHRRVTELLGAEIIAGVENHHNFAWKEVHDGREMIVHRKGATPAGRGDLGVIPGSMADPAFVVRGKGEPSSLNSASHGAGRRMSRTKAKATFDWTTIKRQLAEKGVRVLSAGADEVPGVYKNIEDVMRQQDDLVETVARFDPRIVKMCDDGSRPED